MDRALVHGINYLDTSNIYVLQDGDDWSENVIDLYQMHHVDRATPWEGSGRPWRVLRA
jgi:aryl-alcohol dehydrogenase-like predicted oxidoreductase